MAAPCASNEDCGINELCYADVQWYLDGDFDFTGPQSSDARPGCLCNTFYGFVGPNCSTYSSSTVITMVWQLATALFGVGTLTLLVSNALALHRKGRLRTSLSMTTTVGLSVVSTLFTTLWAFFGYLSATVTRVAPTLVFDFKDQYKGRYNSLNIAFAPLGIGLAALALLHVSLTWLEIAIHSGRLSSKQTTRLTATRRFVLFFEVAAVVTGVAGTAYEKAVGRSIMGFVLAPLVVFIILVYMYSAARLTTILREASRSLETLSPASTQRSGASSPPNSKLDVERSSFTLSDLNRLDEEQQQQQGRQQGRGSVLASLRRPLSVAAAKLRSGVARANGSGVAPGSGSGGSGGGGSGAVVVRADNFGGENPAGGVESLPSERGPARGAGTSPKTPPSPQVKSKVSSNVFYNAVRKVRNTAVSISLCLLLFMIATVGISANDNRAPAGWKEQVKPGGFAAVKAYHHLQMTAIILSQFVIAVYIGVTDA